MKVSTKVNLLTIKKPKPNKMKHYQRAYQECPNKLRGETKPVKPIEKPKLWNDEYLTVKIKKDDIYTNA